MREIVFATNNPHKLEELSEIADAYFPLPTGEGQGEGAINFILPPKGFNPIETGETFEENSLIKAREAARLSGKPALADDSGLCVTALGGAPGVHSARYADTAQGRIDRLLKELESYEDRSAKFVCVMTLVDEAGEILFTARGECHGEIARKQSGINGFGYDPVFIVKDSGKTMAEMSEEEKNLISHRGLALRQILAYFNV
ncbi:MAG: RdgB/HAM1 family non-canonical purine NTP pyrophosphatase [Heliobacteriaceae bacterium]|jgi:XTP/dITP diphosphohydrolase|nr:RdgB/HAM1 family non-canonical purine NTP pyrophosphatase [Heliobacteriaceae bacterium]